MRERVRERVKESSMDKERGRERDRYMNIDQRSSTSGYRRLNIYVKRERERERGMDSYMDIGRQPPSQRREARRSSASGSRRCVTI